MTRILTLLMLMILGAGGLRTQQPNPYQTHGMTNGLMWRSLSYREKMSYASGAMDGWISAAYRVMPVVGECRRMVQAALPAWAKTPTKQLTSGEVEKEMDSFYEDGSNISLPMIDGFEYSSLKLGGASKQELDYYLDIARRGQITLDKQ